VTQPGGVSPQQPDFYSVKPTEPAAPTQDFYAAPKPPEDYYAKPPATAGLPEIARLGSDATSTLGLFQPEEAPFKVRHPVLNAIFVEPIRDLGTFIYHGLRSGAAGRMPSPVYQEQAGREINQYIQALPPEELKRTQRGFALAASFLPAGLVSDAAAPLLARVGLTTGARAVAARTATFLAGEFLGGATYGAIEPLAPGESRVKNILTEGAVFAAAGGVFHAATSALAWGFKKYITANLGIRGVARATEKLNAVKAQLVASGTSFDALPPQVRDQILKDVYEGTVAELEHDPLRVEGFLRNELEGYADRPPVSPHEKSLLPDPDQPFAFAEPLEAPPKGFEPTAAAATTDVERGTAELVGLQPTIAEPPSRLPKGRKPKGFEPTAEEHITGIVVRGRSGKTYPGTTHPQALADAVNSGVPRSEFEGTGNHPYNLEDNMGASTNLRDFVGRAEAGRVADKAAQRDASRAGSKLHSFDIEGFGPSALNPKTPTTGITPEAMADIAVQDAVDRTPVKDVSSPEIKTVIETAKEPPIVPPDRIDPVELVGEVQPEGQVGESGLDALNAAARMHDEEIDALQREFMKMTGLDQPPPVTGLDLLKADMQKIGSAEAEFAREYAKSVAEKGSRRGFAIPRLLSFVALGGSGAGLMISAANMDEDNGAKNVFWMLGGLLTAAALHQGIKGWALERPDVGNAMSKFLRGYTQKLILNAAPQFLMRNAGAKEGARRFIETITYSREIAHNYREKLLQLIPQKAERAFMLSVDEMNAVKGIFPAEYHALTPAQQRAAVATNQFNLRLQQLMRAEGIEEEFAQNYARRVLPAETFDRWRQQGYRQVNPTTRRRLTTLREFEDFAQAHGLPAPTIRPADVQALRITEAYRAIGNVRMRKTMTGLGLIKDGPKTINEAMPQYWRVIRGVPALREKIAPEAVAKAIENLSSPIASRSDILNAADQLKSYWMRGIMFWFWEHGLNSMRAAALTGLNPLAMNRAWKAVHDADPGVLEASKYGLNLRARTDYGLRNAKAMEELVQRVGNIPVLGKLQRGGAWLVEKQDRLLWDQIVPSMQYFTYSQKMLQWAEGASGKFLPGSAEYTAAARRAADFANTVYGRVPTELANPQLMQLMRLAFFSPQWTSSRIALTAGAAGELGQLAAGELKLGDAMYLPLKLRQVAATIAVTWTLSKMLSGKEPEFNPNTTKFYARTGWRNATGREMGLDVLGWWQDELKLFNNPLEYLLGRLNPAFKVAGETITGRDFAGRDMTYPQRLENLARSFGPPTETVEFGARALTPGSPSISGGEFAQRVSGISATFNVSALPRPMDAAVARFSEKLLTRSGLPRNEYLVFELSRLLRSNILSGQDLIDNRVITYLAYRQRNYGIQHPLGFSKDWLWDRGRKILADF